MTKEDDRLIKKLKARPAKAEVGYGRPPEGNQFKRGQSGNPGGRPKGAKNKNQYDGDRFKSIFLAEAFREIKINDGDKQITVPIATAVIRTLAVNAAKGNPRAQKIFTDLLATIEHQKERDHFENFETWVAVKSAQEKELERCKAAGLPAPVPHPDQILINYDTLAVTIVGPLTRQEKETVETMRALQRQCEEQLAENLRRLERLRNPAKRKAIEEEIQSVRSVLKKIEARLEL